MRRRYRLRQQEPSVGGNLQVWTYTYDGDGYKRRELVIGSQNTAFTIVWDGDDYFGEE
jgi:hypothetical protein